MHALLALVIALAAPALSLASPRDRIGFEREIISDTYKQVPNVQYLVLSNNFLATQKNKGKLITKPRPEDEMVVSDNVVLESNVLNIVKPQKGAVVSEVGPALVRERRGYNLENVRVPARYPYLPVPSYNRFRRWG